MSSPQTTDPDHRYDCIVLGAGISGVTAARDLHRAGYRVLVLEGADRVGGRMYSLHDFIRHPDHAADTAAFPLEAGAEYVHIGDKKRYPEFFAELERHDFVTREYPKFQRNRLAFPDWKKNPKKLVLSLLRNTNLIPTVTLLPEVDKFEGDEDMPAGAFVATRKYKGKGLRLGRYTLSSHTPGQLFDPAVDVFEPSIASCRAGAKVSPSGDPRGEETVVDDISILGFQADRLPHQLFYEQSEFKLHRTSGDGGGVLPYDELPQSIAREIEGPSRILLGERVVRVERRDREIVVTTEGADGGREFVGKSALCTFSIGMLDPQGGQGMKIFGDLLTDAKRNALKSVKMGPITKFSLEFKKSHWGKKSRMTVMSHPKGCARTFFSAFPDHKGGPFVLTGLLMNQDHRIVHELDDEAAVQHLLDVLHSLLGRGGERWRPDTVLVEREPGVPNFNRQDWQNDPFSLGGNSFISYQGLDRAAVGLLRETLRDPGETLPLFWAGEATAPAYDSDYEPLAVHGAYISGVGAARDIGDYLAGDRTDEAFQALCRERMDKVTARRTETLEATEAITVHLTEREHSRLSFYADARNDGDLGAAAAELCRIGIYWQVHEPRSLGGRPARRDPARAIEFRLKAEELRRIRAWAAEHAKGDVNLTLRALLRRAF